MQSLSRWSNYLTKHGLSALRTQSASEQCGSIIIQPNNVISLSFPLSSIFLWQETETEQTRLTVDRLASLTTFNFIFLPQKSARLGGWKKRALDWTWKLVYRHFYWSSHVDSELLFPVVQIIFSLLFFYADSRVTAADIQLHSANDCDKVERFRDDISSAC